MKVKNSYSKLTNFGYQTSVSQQTVATKLTQATTNLTQEVT